MKFIMPLRHWVRHSKYVPSEHWYASFPSHWTEKRVKHLFKIHNGATPKSKEPTFWDGDVKWITPDDLGSMSGFEVLTTSRNITSNGYDSCGTSFAPPGSLAVSTRAPIGHLGIIRDTMCCNQGCRLLEPKVSLNEWYFLFFFEAATTDLQSHGQGSTFKELSRRGLAEFPVLLPPLEEQIAISAFLQTELEFHSQLRQSVGTPVPLFEEYRRALFSDVVTGKIDVRDAIQYNAV